MAEKTPPSSPVAFLDSDACDAEESLRVRRWKQFAAAGWAMAFIATAIALVGWIRPALVAGYGPNSVSMKSQWEDFEFRYPDSVAAFWQPWGSGAAESDAVLGEVWWSESAQKGLARFTGLEPLDGSHAADPHAGAHEAERLVYQFWISASADANPVRISAGLFEVPHEPSPSAGDHAEREVLVSFEPAMAVRDAVAMWVTIEPAGGVWASDLSRPVARAILPTPEDSSH